MTRPSDIIVIGAGVVGCAIAEELAHRGASVEIIDERPVGMGATQASAGVLAPYIETREGHPLLDLTVRSLGLYDAFVARVAADSGVSLEYRRSGTITVAADEAEWHALQAAAQFLSRCNASHALLDAAAAASEEPHLADSVIGGLLINEHGFVAANDLTRALVTSARRRGAQLIEQSKVRRIFTKGDDLVVETDRGTLSTDAVVLAAGSWSGGIEVDGLSARLPVRPVRGQLLYLSWPGTPLRRVTWTHRCYFVPWDDGTVLVGATMEEVGFDERVTVAGVRDLLESACELLPHAWSAGFRGARVGLRPGTPDDLPVIGVSATMPNLVYATGHYRNGVLLAPLTAQLVADALLERKVDSALTAVNPSRAEGRLGADGGQPGTVWIVSYRIDTTERDGQWIARARDEASGDPFGVEYSGPSEAAAVERLERWLDWQREHAAALESLQQAERAYHRTIAGSAFLSPSEDPSPIELQKESLEAVEAARVRLDEVRERKPE